MNDHLNIHYTLSFPQAHTHYMEVEMNISNITQPFINLKMPVWTPGSYLVREYARNVESLTTWNNGQLLSAKKINKNTWHVVTAGVSEVIVKYSLYCFEISVRNNFVNAAHAFVSGANTFLYPEGMLANPSTIYIKPYRDWDKVSTSLDMVDNNPFTVYAPDYDILYDSPLEIGTQDVFEFEAAGVQYEIAMCLGGNYDKERVIRDLTKMAEVETKIFGENPNHRYVYIVHNYAKGYGGLEHSSSTVLSNPRESYATEDGYQRFLALAAHEHFHLWNVKRLRPIALGPFNYDQENYTTELWIAEGFTNYYDNLVVHRMGLYDTENYLTALANDINKIENAPGNKVQPLYEAGFDAWIKFYRPNENSGNSTISYYSKGTVIALLLELEIINASNGKYSLDDLMKYMYTEYYKNKNRGYTDTEFKAGLEKFAGKSLDDIYEKYIYGLDAINYNKYLAYAGFELIDTLAENNTPSLGITATTINGKITITTVIRDGSGWIDGLNVNDEITEIDSRAITSLTDALTEKKVGDQVTVNLIRDGITLSLPVTLLKNGQVKYKISETKAPTSQQQAIRTKWLKVNLL